MDSIFEELRSLLITDARFVAAGELLKNQVTEQALKLDKDLLALLLSRERLRDQFFVQISSALVFDKERFIRFVNNKEFLPDSYTAFQNKIGLTVNEIYLIDTRDVVLSWPFKDTVLEGGQTKEDAKRDEVFWNEILAPDEIDRLLAPKVLTNWRRYGTAKGKKEKTVFQDSDNLILKGNNLLALHSLKKRFERQVKLIYIDPPYNTGNDEFKYNDTFNHSTWLTFMKNRLEVAKELLTDDGSIFVSIDANEVGYLMVLMDEVFHEDNRQSIITIKRGSVTGHKTINQGVVNLAEYVLVYAKNRTFWNPNRVYRQRERNPRYDKFIKNRDRPMTEWQFSSLLDVFAEHKGIAKSKLKRELGDDFENQIFSFVIQNASAVVQLAYPDQDKVSADVRKLISRSRKHKKEIMYKARENEPDIYLLGGQRILFYSDRLINLNGEMVTGEPISDIWIDVLPNDLHNEGGVKLKKGKKPEKLLQRILELGSSPGDLVLDFHLGSGTAAAVAHKMKRRYLGVEQLEYGENDSVERLKNVIAGDSTGISKSVNWKGGGSFVYCELKQWNNQFLPAIRAANDKKELGELWRQMKATAQLSYRVNLAEVDEHAADFVALSVEDQKRFLREALDRNGLYVNLTEMDDETYGVTDDDKRLNRQFYRL